MPIDEAYCDDRTVTDEPNDEAKNESRSRDGSRTDARHPRDPRYSQRNLAERLFPGPSPQMSKQYAKNLEGLLGDGSRRTRSASVGGRPAALDAPKTVSPEDVAQLRQTLEEQNELLRAILAGTVDTQEDARATAQNSRTFAWAGTAIALLTLIATVIAIVAAVRAN
jgi:hypothetical protein